MTSFESGLAPLDLPKPDPEADELLVRVEAASINPIDVYGAMGGLQGMIEYDFPMVFGRDFAGTVEAVGSDVVGLEAGDAVVGYVSNPSPRGGSWAEYVTVSVDGFVVPRPGTLDAFSAAALPVAALTALAAVDAVDPEPGDVVLIVGAAGGVGSFAVQLAAQRGATVIATVRPGDEERLRGFGAAETIDYTSVDIAERVRELHPGGVRGLIDLVDRAEAFAAMAALVEDGGRAASPVGAAAEDARITAANISGATPGPAGLARLVESAAAGELKVTVDSVRPLDEVPAAVEEFPRGKRGKIVISVSP